MADLYKPRPERWPQFSLRTAFVLMTILGVSLGWGSVQVQWIRDRQAAIQQALKDERITYYSYGGPKKSPWNLQLFGEVGSVLVGIRSSTNSKADRELHAKLKRLFPEAEVTIAPAFEPMYFPLGSLGELSPGNEPVLEIYPKGE